MFRCLKRIITHIKARVAAGDLRNDGAPASDARMSESITQNLDCLKGMLGDSSDIIVREFNFGRGRKTKAALIMIEGLANKAQIDLAVLQPLMFDTGPLPRQAGGGFDMDAIGKSLLATCKVKKVADPDDMVGDILSGNTILLVDGSAEALSIGARKFEHRSVDEPGTENVVRGPREGFTESLRANTSMLRRRVKNPGLRFDAVKVGRQTGTDVCIAYINGIVKPGLVEEIKNRLQRVQTDSVLDSGYVEAFIEDSPYSIFATVGSSERPDAVAGKLLEGRAAVFVDGSPFVLTVPMLFIEHFQTAEDYYIRSYYASSLRIIRVISFIITIMAPAVYVALTTFHQELIPTQLLFTMAAGHEGIPFPAMVEAILMMVLFDILREAGVRLPKAVGSAVSIVGALVLGEAAVSAGLIGPFMVIVVAITAISSFVVPTQADSTSVLRYCLMLLAGFLGGFGVVMGLLFTILHLASMESFGMPYLSPIVPMEREGMRDAFVRMPLLSMVFRPRGISGENRRRRVDSPRTGGEGKL